MMFKKIAKVFAVTTIALIGVNANAEEPIKIGSVLSTTGPAAFLGDPQIKTLEMYIDSINEDGGLLGRPLKLVIYDDASDAAKANSFAKRLIYNDDVDVIIGGTTTGSTMSMIPLAEKGETPFISMAGAISIVEPIRKWVFKTPLTDRIVAEKLLLDMQDRGLNKIALLSETSGFGQSGKKETGLMAKKVGVEIVEEETYGPKDTDMSPQLTKIKNNPDVQAILIFGIGQGPAIATRNYQQQSMDQPLYLTHGVCSDEFIKLAGNAAEGARLPCAAMLVSDALDDDDPQKPVVSEYVESFKQKWDSDVSNFGGNAYDGLMMYVDAVKRAGTTDKSKVRDAIESTEGLMLTAGEFNMSPDNHMGLDVNAYRILEIKDGNWSLAN